MNDWEILVDPDERDHVVELVRSHDHGSGFGDSIKRLLVEPLWVWVDAEYQRMGNRHHSGTEAALKLVEAAEDVVYRYQNQMSVYPEHASIIERRWNDWLATVAEGEIAIRVAKAGKRKKQNSINARTDRHDRVAIYKAYDAFVEQYGKPRGAVPAISAELEIPESTVRRYLNQRK
ncbi:MAG: hypothetical protein NXH95_01300 [Pseudomonadaceae bacterium]|nr:hypothetical protein [Pseudomonadaceae bacterium]